MPTSIQTLYQGFVPKWTSQTNKRNIPSCFQCLERKLAGAAGFEPANAGIKSRCLTTWRRPNEARP